MNCLNVYKMKSKLYKVERGLTMQRPHPVGLAGRPKRSRVSDVEKGSLLPDAHVYHQGGSGGQLVADFAGSRMGHGERLEPDDLAR